MKQGDGYRAGERAFCRPSRSAEHRDHAQTLGATWVGGAEETPPVLLDASVTFAPAGWIVPRALEHLRPGGTLAINAIHMSPIPELPYPLLYGERTVRSVANFTAQDAEEYLRLAAAIPVRTEVEVWPLAEANAALRRLKRSEVYGAAVLQVTDQLNPFRFRHSRRGLAVVPKPSLVLRWSTVDRGIVRSIGPLPATTVTSLPRVKKSNRASSSCRL